MTTRRSSVPRQAAARLSARFAARQTGLAVLLLGLFILWLRVPDASVIEVLFSVLFALVILALAGGGESALLLQLCARSVTLRRLIGGMSILFAAAVLWFGWKALLEASRAHEGLWAGYFNSRFPRALRGVFSYPHLLTALDWLLTMLGWIGAGILAIIAAGLVAAGQPMRTIARTLRSVPFWIAWIVSIFLATIITRSLMNWVPGRALGVEMLSLILRLLVTVLIDGCILSFLVALLAIFVREDDATYSAVAGTPEVNQPRTADRP